MAFCSCLFLCWLRRGRQIKISTLLDCGEKCVTNDDLATPFVVIIRRWKSQEKCTHTHTHTHTEVKVVLVFLSFNLFSRICLIKSICGLKSVNYKDICSCFMEKSCVCDFDGNRYTCRRLVFSGGGGLLVFLSCMYIYARFFTYRSGVKKNSFYWKNWWM